MEYMERENTPPEEMLNSQRPEDAGGGPSQPEPGGVGVAEGEGPGFGRASAETTPVCVKACILNRIIARFIDILFVLLLARLPGFIGFFAALTYIGIADGLMDGRSLGKRIIGLRVYRPEKGRAADFRDSILRNSTIGFLFVVSRVPYVGWAVAAAGLGFELVLMIGSPEGRRLGDEIASTKVMEEAAARPAPAGE